MISQMEAGREVFRKTSDHHHHLPFISVAFQTQTTSRRNPADVCVPTNASWYNVWLHAEFIYEYTVKLYLDVFRVFKLSHHPQVTHLRSMCWLPTTVHPMTMNFLWRLVMSSWRSPRVKKVNEWDRRIQDSTCKYEWYSCSMSSLLLSEGSKHSRRECITILLDFALVAIN